MSTWYVTHTRWNDGFETHSKKNNNRKRKKNRQQNWLVLTRCTICVLKRRYFSFITGGAINSGIFQYDSREPNAMHQLQFQSICMRFIVNCIFYIKLHTNKPFDEYLTQLPFNSSLGQFFFLSPFNSFINFFFRTNIFFFNSLALHHLIIFFFFRLSWIFEQKTIWNWIVNFCSKTNHDSWCWIISKRWKKIECKRPEDVSMHIFLRIFGLFSSEYFNRKVWSFKLNYHIVFISFSPLG